MSAARVLVDTGGPLFIESTCPCLRSTCSWPWRPTVFHAVPSCSWPRSAFQLIPAAGSLSCSTVMFLSAARFSASIGGLCISTAPSCSCLRSAFQWTPAACSLSSGTVLFLSAVRSSAGTGGLCLVIAPSSRLRSAFQLAPVACLATVPSCSSVRGNEQASVQTSSSRLVQ